MRRYGIGPNNAGVAGARECAIQYATARSSEREGFEPPQQLPADRISNAAPSATRTPLQDARPIGPARLGIVRNSSPHGKPSSRGRIVAFPLSFSSGGSSEVTCGRSRRPRASRRPSVGKTYLRRAAAGILSHPIMPFVFARAPLSWCVEDAPCKPCFRLLVFQRLPFLTPSRAIRIRGFRHARAIRTPVRADRSRSRGRHAACEPWSHCAARIPYCDSRRPLSARSQPGRP